MSSVIPLENENNELGCVCVVAVKLSAPSTFTLQPICTFGISEPSANPGNPKFSFMLISSKEIALDSCLLLLDWSCKNTGLSFCRFPTSMCGYFAGLCRIDPFIVLWFTAHLTSVC